MKASDVQIGRVYGCKVSGKVVPVKVLRESDRATYSSSQRAIVYRRFWVAKNLATSRMISIKSAQRLRPMRHVSQESRGEL